MSTVTFGTFNIQNLFSRFDFSASIEDGTKIEDEGLTTFSFDETVVKLREYEGSLIKAKPENKRKAVAARIQQMNLDVLALQEVEDIDTLTNFVNGDLAAMYPHITLVEGNDPRLIDVALLSKLPLGPVTSWRHAVHPARAKEPIFGRDLLQVEILDESRKTTLFTVFVNHLKSQLVKFDDPNPEATEAENNLRRKQQAETIAKIIKERLGADARYIIAGDMNDTPEADTLAPLRALEVVNGLDGATESRVFTDPTHPPPHALWTYRHLDNGKASYQLLDQIWLSASLAKRKTSATIDRRKNLTGDGTDHDCAHVAFEL